MKRCLAAALALILMAPACARKAPPARSEVQDLQRSPEEWLREEPIRLLRDYIRIDTRPAKGEKEGAEFLQRILSCEGISTDIVCPAPGRCNLLARIPGRRHDNALLLLNHIDVVDAYPQYWKEAPPFEGVIKHGYLYGRGAFDMKSLGLAQALAMRDLKRAGVVPESDILFLAEADEEIGQRFGARWLLDHRPEWFAGVGQVLNEGGTTEVILRSVRFWGLETLQAGYGVIEFEAATDAPLAALAARWPRLEANSVAPHPQVVQGFGMLANHLVSPVTDSLRHLDRVRRDPRELALLPERYACFLEPRLFWSPGYRNPAHPDRARRVVTVSTPPGVSPRPFLESILQDAAKQGLTVLTLMQSEATVASPYPSPFTELLKRVVEARYPGVPFGPLPTSGGYTTSILLRERGIPAYGFQAIPMNYADASRRHGNDERVFLRDYLDGVSLFSDVVAEFAQFPGPSTSVTR